MQHDNRLTGLVPRLKRALSGQFVLGVLKLAGGAALSQAILLVALVIATRLYSPADFGVLAVFNAIVAIIGVAACLRFDIAVPLPNNRSDAINLLALSFLCAACVAAVFALLVLIVPDKWALSLTDPTLNSVLWLAAPGIFLMAALSAAQNWHIREKAYGTISRSRIAQSLLQAAIQIGGGFSGGGALVLIIAQIANYSAGVALLLGGAINKKPSDLNQVSRARLQAITVEYKRFPVFSTWEALFNAAGIFLPVILIGTLATTAEVGHLQLGLYAMQAMIGLVGTAISQVYFSRAAEEHHAGRLSAFTGTVLANLAKTGPGPLLFIGVTGPVLFPILFGEEWARSGVLVAWMTPWFIMQFLASPISLALAVTGHQKAAFLLQLSGLILRTGAVLVAAYGLKGYIAESYAISGFVFYAVYLAVIWKTTRLVFVWDEVRRTMVIGTVWVGTSIFTCLVLGTDYISSMFDFLSV